MIIIIILICNYRNYLYSNHMDLAQENGTLEWNVAIHRTVLTTNSLTFIDP